MTAFILKEDHGRLFNPNTDVQKVIANNTYAVKTIDCSYSGPGGRGKPDHDDRPRNDERPGMREEKSVGNECSNISIFRMKVMTPGTYFIYISFNFTEENSHFIDHFEMSGRTVTFEFALLQGAVKAILFVGSLVGTALLWCNFRKMRDVPNAKIFEQKYVLALNIIMCFFFDPFAILQQFFPSTFG